MKKTLLLTTVVLLCVLLTTACTSAEQTPAPERKDAAADVSDTTQTTQTPEDTPAEQSEPEKQAEDDDAEYKEQKILVYLSVLGLDEQTEYTVCDWFDIEGSDDKSLLIDILNISEERFDEVEAYLRTNGFTHPQDPTYDEVNNVRFIHNSNDSLFMEMGYFENEMRINIIFTPR